MLGKYLVWRRRRQDDQVIILGPSRRLIACHRGHSPGEIAGFRLSIDRTMASLYRLCLRIHTRITIASRTLLVSTHSQQVTTSSFR